MLPIIDISLSQPMTIPRSYDFNASAQVLTGLEPFGMLEIRKKGFMGSNPILKSSRAAVLARAIHEVDGTAASQGAGDLPAKVSDAIKSGASLADAIKGACGSTVWRSCLDPCRQGQHLEAIGRLLNGQYDCRRV